MKLSQPRPRPGLTTTALMLVAAMMACTHRSSAPGEDPGERELDSRTVLEADELNSSASSIEEMIEGRLPGVLVERLGGALYVQIRGPSTIRGSNQALIVIDGIQASGAALLNMNPNDVDRIEVLKGASAAVYGIRGANGVLLVTTRRR